MIFSHRYFNTRFADTVRHTKAHRIIFACAYDRKRLTVISFRLSARIAPLIVRAGIAEAFQYAAGNFRR